MRLEHRHEWELEGDLAATVILDLAFIAKVTPLGLESLQLVEVDPVGVTFAMQGEDIVCDGANNGYGQPPNALLPIALLSWFSSRFLERWTEKPQVRQGFVDLLNETAIGMYYEQMAGAT